MVHVLDNLFTDKFLFEIYEDTLANCDFAYTNVANRYQHPHDFFCKGSHRFFGTSLYYQVSNNFFKNKMTDKLMEVYEWVIPIISKMSNKKLFLHKVNANLQFKGMDGTWHVDDTHRGGVDRTAIFFPHYKWEDHWGGEFQVLGDEDQISDSYMPLPGRILFFDSTVRHRGLAPNEFDVPRVSIAFRFIEM